ncbi:hypothetical protein [Seonamhaeicola marinus]|uniref:DUF4179 domain-containing protein n=1 Tax=Seonamhaeicola marinus TaxID=1912246 RepID=A0A5D0HK43_9FLAO|nr:hypothetical protein [Seonamhaeicola marinus]TYA71691.1 hypothetical protein FUA24_19210 [Seonamhaeicola marinus]
MSKDNIDNLFDRLQNEFDIEQPALNHKERFLNKLNNQSELALIKEEDKLWRRLWKPLVGVAAAVILMITFVFKSPNENGRDLASVSPKMAQTQDFFLTSINEELFKLQAEKSPEAQVIVQDAMKRLKVLEDKYENLKTDLSESGDDTRVIYAMISNFQNRIDILKSTIEKINHIKELKNQSNETNITI